MKTQRWLAIFLAMTWLTTARAVDNYVSLTGTNDTANGYTNLASTGTVTAAEFLRPENVRLACTNDLLTVSFDYRRAPETCLEDLRFYLRKDGRDLVLTYGEVKAVIANVMAKPSGRVAIEVPAHYLPGGMYQLVMKGTIRKEPGNHLLKGKRRALLQLKNLRGKDMEISLRIPAGVAGQAGSVYLRGKDGMYVGAHSWELYGAGFDGSAVSLWAYKNNAPLFPQLTNPPAPRGLTWQNVVFRCKGNRLEVEVDGKPTLSTVDEKQTFTEGNVGFLLNGTVCYFDQLVVKDLNKNEIVFQDDFERETVGDRWQVLCGEWTIEKGFPVREELTLGRIEIPKQTPGKSPVVKLKRRADAMTLRINGNPCLPLIYTTATTMDAPYSDVTYDLLRTIHQAGMRIISLDIPPLSFDAKGQLDFSQLDAIMTQSALACPDDYFLLRMPVRNPLDLPAAEKTVVARRPGDLSDSLHGDNGIMENFNASIASERYREYAPQAMVKHIEHIRSQLYSDRVIGTLVQGIGFEWSMGNPGSLWGLFMDVSPAQVKKFGGFLRKKYGSVEALRKAWGNDRADFDNPPLPGIEERTVSDVAGFFDPSQPHSRWVLDFLTMYADETNELLIPIYAAIARVEPHGFYGGYYLPTMNIHWGGMQTIVDRMAAVLDMPALTFNAGILGYGDRKAGGISISTSCAWETILRHEKLALNEADIRQPFFTDGSAEPTYEGMIEVMRREFAFTVLIERRAMWYYDAGFGAGPWYEDPRLHMELAREMAIGEQVLKLEHRNMAETLVVLDNEALKYFAYTTTPLKKGEDIPWGNKWYAYDTVHANLEQLMRVGFPNNMILASDLRNNEKAKLLIFPTQFYCDKARRECIQRLIKRGAVAVFTGAAGLVNETSASAGNMEELLGMKMGVGLPGPLVAHWVDSEHLLGKALKADTLVGEERVEWYRYYVDDPEAIVLARYKDGKAAMAAKPYGKGLVIYSGVPIMQPAVYRAAARAAGVHVYAEGDDAFYADNNFVMIHTKEAGKKQIRLPAPAREVREVFTGEGMGRDTDLITVTLPEKHTALFYIGNDRKFREWLSSHQGGKP